MHSTLFMWLDLRLKFVGERKSILWLWLTPPFATLLLTTLLGTLTRAPPAGKGHKMVHSHWMWCMFLKQYDYMWNNHAVTLAVQCLLLLTWQKCFVCVCQSSVNKLVSIILSGTKDIPLWTFSHLQFKQQQVWFIVSFLSKINTVFGLISSSQSQCLFLFCFFTAGAGSC